VCEKAVPSRIPVDEEESSALSRGVKQLSEQCSHKNLVLVALIGRGACGLIHTPSELTIKAKKLLPPTSIKAQSIPRRKKRPGRFHPNFFKLTVSIQ
jgi:hypothetical protein